MKRFLRILCLSLAVIMLSVNVSAAQIYKEGTDVTFHNASPYYIIDDTWVKGSYFTEMRDGVLYASIEDFRAAFKCKLSYNYKDTSIYLQLAEKTLWQGLGYDTAFTDGNSVYAPAPYISSASGHPVMIPLKFYAEFIGYSSNWETPDSYLPGVMSFNIEKVPYNIVGLEVNQAAQLVTVMGKSPTGKIEPVKYMLCSTGVGSATPNGTFKVNPLGTNWYYFSLFNCYVMYCSQLTGNICFHSLTFNTKDINSLSKAAYNNLAQKPSHGCIRLYVEDAKFIHQYCKGLPVTISNGYTNSETDAIKAQLLAAKIPYEDYVNSLK